MPPYSHAGEVTAVAFSPDGRYVLSGAGDLDNTVLLWTEEGRLIKILGGHLNDIADVEISPDGLYMITLEAKSGALHLWDKEGRLVRVLNDLNLTEVCFAPDGKHFAGANRSGKLILYDLNGKQVREFRMGDSDEIQIFDIAFSKDGGRVAACDAMGLIHLFNIGGALQNTLDGHGENAVRSIEFTPDGTNLISGGDDKMAILWDLANGNVLQKMGPHQTEVDAVAVSPDGRYMATAGLGDSEVTFWDAQGKPVIAFEGNRYGVYELAFAPDSRSVLVGGREKKALRFDLEGKQSHAYANDSSPVTSVGFSPFSPDSLFIVTGGEGMHVRLWDAVSGEAEGFPDQEDINTPVAFNPQYPVLLIGETGDSIYQWDLYSLQQRRFKQKRASSTAALAYSPDGEYFLTGNFSGSLQLWRDDDGAIIWDKKLPSNRVNSLAFSPDGNMCLVATDREGAPAIVFMPEAGHEQPSNPKGFPASLYNTRDFSPILSFGTSSDQAVFSPDGNYVATNEAYELSIYDSRNGAELAHAGGTHAKNLIVMCLAFDPASQSVAAGYSDNTIRQYDLKGKLLREYKGHGSAVRSVAFSPDGRYLISGSSDNTAKIWDAASGREKVTLMAIGTNDWVVVTPEGLFDASEGAMSQLYFVAGLEIIELEQLKGRYYEPGLLARVMGYAEGELRKVQDLDAEELALYPLLLDAAVEGDKIKVRLQKRSGGIGAAVVLMDGDIELIPDANPKRLESFEIDLSRYAGYFMANRPNRLSLILYNREGWLSGPPFDLEYIPAEPKEKGNNNTPAPPSPGSLSDKSDQALTNTLYALVVGTSDYAGAELDLRFPDQDALAYKEVLQLSGAALFGARMNIKLLTTVSGGTKPTKTAIRTALLEFAAKAEPKDILLVYFSGHGTTWPQNSAQGQFYYLTADNSSFNFDDAKNRGYAISQDSLQAWIRGVKARKRILILDACNSGEVVKQLDTGAKGTLNSDQRRALERMKDRAGFFVLAGSAADKSSYEDPRFGHGLLTYSLLRNMPKVAAGDKNHYVDVGKLFTEVREDVPKLAGELKKIQEPKLIGMEDFSIGIIKDASAVKLPTAKKIITRSAFSNKKRVDPIKLTGIINDELEKMLATPTLKFAYWPVDQAAGPYYFLNGEYEQTGTGLKITAYFYKSGEDNELKSFTVSGNSGQVKNLVEDLLGQFAEYLEGMR